MSEVPTYQPDKAKTSFKEKFKGSRKQSNDIPMERWDNIPGIPVTTYENGDKIPTFLTFFYGDWRKKSIEEMEQQKKLMDEILARDDVPMRLKAMASGKHAVLSTELLYHKDPEFKRMRDLSVEQGNKRMPKRIAWEQHIIQTEGQEALNKKMRFNQDPDFHTPEELQLYVDMTRKEVEAGILHKSELEAAEKIKEMGGFNKYRRQSRKENMLQFKKELEAMGDNHDAKKIIRNIDRDFKEEGYLDEEKKSG